MCEEQKRKLSGNIIGPRLENYIEVFGNDVTLMIGAATKLNLEVLPHFFFVLVSLRPFLFFFHFSVNLSLSLSLSLPPSLAANFRLWSSRLATWACRRAQARNHIDVAPSNGEKLRQGVQSQRHWKAWSCAAATKKTQHMTAQWKSMMTHPRSSPNKYLGRSAVASQVLINAPLGL